MTEHTAIRSRGPLDTAHARNRQRCPIHVRALEDFQPLPDALDRCAEYTRRERHRDATMGVEGAEADPRLGTTGGDIQHSRAWAEPAREGILGASAAGDDNWHLLSPPLRGNRAPTSLRLLLAQRREGDGLADAVLVAEQHDEPVHAAAEAAGRRHAHLQRLDVVLVQDLRLVVAARALPSLILEARALIQRVV